MERLFSMDGKLINFMNRIADMVLLNLLWIICSIPIVTIGASTTALYAVTLKMARNEDSYICSSFFGAFRENFKQATCIWGLILGIAGVLYFDFYFSSHMESGGARYLFIVFAVIAFLLIMTTCYVFPILAFFENSTKKAVKNSLMMAAAHLPYTAVIIVTSFVPILILFSGNLVMALFLDIIIGVSLSAWANAHIFRKLFERYIK